jgi:DNA-binding MarR family transcriptional regulator
MALSSLMKRTGLVFARLGLHGFDRLNAHKLARRLNYVNIADLMSSSMSSDASKADAAGRVRRGEAPMYELIELFFFAYRDFVGDADRLLETFGFGRAHHRVLYFVTRRPGLTIAELLEILRITKQSLNRVLRELVDKNFIEIRAGALDRRRRQLYATLDGERLALRLAQVQTRRFALALDQLGDWGVDSATAFLTAMVDPQKPASDSTERQAPAKRAGGKP